MNLQIRRTACRSALVALAFLLSACGGGGDSGPGDTPPSAKAPLALADTANATANQGNTLDVLGNDSHPDKLALELVSVGTAAHGSAEIKNNAVVYTPAAGYYGPDKVSYIVRGAGSTLTATAEVNLMVGMPLRLKGKVGFAAGTASSVTVMVGQRPFTQAVSAGAGYDMPVVLEAPDQMVSVTAQAAGATAAHVKFITLVGEARILLAAASGGVLADSQLADLNVNLASTAKYVLMRDKNGGVVPASQAAFDAAAHKVALSELFQIAGLLRLTTSALGADQPQVALPAGKADTLALALDTPALRKFADAYLPVGAPSAALDKAVTDVQQDTALQSQPGVAVDRTRVVTMVPVNEANGVSGVELELAPNGTARLALNGSTHAASWTAEDGALKVQALQLIVQQDELWAGRVADLALYSIRFNQISGGPAHGVMSMTFTVRAQYKDGALPFEEYLTQTKVFEFHTWDSLAPLNAADVAGKTLAGIPDLSNPLQLSVVENLLRVAFGADGTATVVGRPDVTANWSLQEGKLRLAFNDGSTQELARLEGYAPGAPRWLSRYSKGTAAQLYQTPMAEVQPGLAFTSATQAVQTWNSLAAAPGFRNPFHIVLNADLSGMEQNISLEGVPSLLYNSSWLLEDGRLIITVYRLPNGTRAGVCPADVTCTLQSRRRWTLLREDGDTITVLDNYSTQFSQPTRIIRYQRLPR